MPTIVLDGGRDCPLANALDTLSTGFQYDPRMSVCTDALGLLQALIVGDHPALSALQKLEEHYETTCAGLGTPALRRDPVQSGPTLPGPVMRKALMLAAVVRHALAPTPISVQVLTTASELTEFYTQHTEAISDFHTVTARTTPGRFDPEQPGLTWMAQHVVFYEARPVDPDDQEQLIRPIATINTAHLCRLAAACR
jgi:hypothetical protein